MLIVSLLTTNIIAQCDFNEDGFLDVADIVASVDCIFAGCFETGMCDWNDDGTLDVGDIVGMVYCILEECWQPNTAPEITALTADPTSLSPDGTSVITCTAADADGDPLNYAWESTAGVISGEGPEVSFTAPVALGGVTVTCTVSDGIYTVSESIELTVVNHDPEITNLTADPPSVQINGVSTLTCSATDGDGDALSYDWSATDGIIDGNGPEAIFTAPGFETSVQITCTVTDGFASVSASMELTVTIYGTVTDVDGNTYQTIIIGNREWMMENLKVTHYRNGDEIPILTSDADWMDADFGARCAYNNDDSNAEEFGLIYNWYAVNDSRNIAPEGWHVATDAEWKELEMFLGMSQSEADAEGWRGTNEGSKLAGNVDSWTAGELVNDPQFGESGFTGLPGGFRFYTDGGFSLMGDNGYFWTLDENSSTNAWRRKLKFNTTQVSRNNFNKKNGFNVRCVKGDFPQIVDLFSDLDEVGVNSQALITCNAIDPDGDDLTYTWEASSGTIVGNGSEAVYTSPGNSGTASIICTVSDGYLSVSESIEITIFPSVMDIDGNVYRTVVIGDQVWMAENLRVTHYRNGDPIPNVTSNNSWTDLTWGAYCYYENNPENDEVYGKLYNYYAVIDSRNIAIEGWHVPTDAEWVTLANYLGGLSVAGGKLKESGTEHWHFPNTGATNESGFTGLPGGYRDFSGGGFSDMNYAGRFWSYDDDEGSKYTRLNYDETNLRRYSSYLFRWGHSIRLVKDN